MNLAVQETFRIKTYIQILHQKREKALRVHQRDAPPNVQFRKRSKEISDGVSPGNVRQLPTCSRWLWLWRHCDMSGSVTTGHVLQPWGSTYLILVFCHWGATTRILWGTLVTEFHKRPKFEVHLSLILQYHSWLLGIFQHIIDAPQALTLCGFLHSCSRVFLWSGRLGHTIGLILKGEDIDRLKEW